LETQIGVDEMTIPISFDEVAYFDNEYRGNLIVTAGVLYFFPHTRVRAARFATELQGKETVETIGLIGNVVPGLAAVPWAFQVVDKSVKIGKFLKRSFAPTVNKAQIRKLRLWHGNESSKVLQNNLDAYLLAKRSERLEFEDDSVPKPMRFEASEMENMKFGFKFRFDAKYDNHDFRINPIRRALFRKSLKEGGFL